MIKQQLNSLLNKEMDRKDFLKYSGSVFLAAIGVTGMVRLLLGQGGVSIPTQYINGNPQRGESSLGYGGSAYGR